MEESNQKEILICGGCLNDISDEDYVSALSQDWHRDCFRCSVCDAQLTTWFFEKGGLLFCREDYWTRFGDVCHRCGQVVYGSSMAAGELRYHSECFACAACGSLLGETELYALVDRDTLYCGGCSPNLSSSRSTALVQPQLDASGALALRVECVLEKGGEGKVLQGVRGRGKEVVDERGNEQTIHHIQPPIEHNPDTINVKRGSSDVMKTSSNGEDMKKENKKEEAGLKRERLFKRKGEDGGKVRVIKRRQTPSSPLLGEKEKSSSMSKLLDVSEGGPPAAPGVLDDLSRARSFRTHANTQQRVFRDADLIQGELLGTGFFGHVYKVTHRATGELMVLKQLYRVDDTAQNNFLKEVAVLRSLRHRNVLRFEGVLYRERLHLVTEYVAGGTLHDLLQDKSRPLSWETRVRLARDVAAGVGYLHCRNVIHRDLNSHNCLIRPGEELTVVVADFGLARIVRRTDRNASSRKRYTVVGNPYWMAPEMMNGNLYDEKVDVFSFGIILCEIIGRVSADPDYMPRRSDFGLNERVFRDKFCSTCPEPFYRLAFLACQLDPDARPPFEVMEVWLDSLVRHLSAGGTLPQALLRDVLQYGGRHGVMTRDADDGPEESQKSGSQEGQGVVKSQSTLELELQSRDSEGRALGKCVSAGALWSAGPAARPGGRAARRSTQALTPGYILRPHQNGIDVTRVDDISCWVDPHLPAFMRNQSEEGLQTSSKREIRPSVPFCRHDSIPACSDSDSSDDDLLSPSPLPAAPLLTDIMKKGGALLAARGRYDVTEEAPGKQRGATDDDAGKYNKKSPVTAKWIENIPKAQAAKPPEKTGFFTKTLGSPKLRRLFRPNNADANHKPETDKDRSKSNFFVQKPAGAVRSAYRVRPASDERSDLNRNVLECDIKLANMGTPMTPTFRRHQPVDRDFKDGRFSYRERRFDPPRTRPPDKMADNKNNIITLAEKIKDKDGKDAVKRRPIGITRSNYVKLENLRISKDGAHLV
ncbi:LIM domain kinase 1 isoform 2 [Danaus plexippus plexippus]|uniref:LIM domain kinase 1 n=1 Tax=Danaus plexippus plexippus TaxID=278856 RepID=A0A212FMY9_DANPL|nr:LIM domain kinase 1 isoform 2 [Danaus plexippus plexippus]